jgi:hypothetical protein
MSIPNCFPQNSVPSSMNEFFPTLPDRFPPVYLCQFAGRSSYDKQISERNQPIKYDSYSDINGKNDDEYFNLTGSGDKQKGYSRHIDVDSELKRINHYGDKCFYNDYKQNPRDTKTDLNRHKDILIKDYQSVQKGTFKDPDYNNPSCLNFSSTFMGYQNKKLEEPYHQVEYDFNNDYLKDYPCQKVWNNLTKRYGLVGTNSKKNNLGGECLESSVNYNQRLWI